MEKEMNLVERFLEAYASYIPEGSATLYMWQGQVYAIADNPVLSLEFSEDEDIDKAIRELVEHFGRARKHCNDDYAYHFEFDNKTFHVCTSDTTEVRIYLEFWG